MGDDEWRGLARRDCNISVRLDPDKTCGEEMYFPLDVHLLLCTLWHWDLMRLLIGLATHERIEALVRLLSGSWAPLLLWSLPLTGSVIGLLCFSLLCFVIGACKRCCCCFSRTTSRATHIPQERESLVQEMRLLKS